MTRTSRFEDLKDAVSALYPTLSKQLQQIARFALDRPNELALGTVAGIAEAAGVQPSALIRFANALGFKYAYNEKREEYVHPAAIALVTPKAHISRYLYGLEYHPKTLRLSLVESSEGLIGTTVDRLILYCFHYDSSEGRYAPVARNIMRLGGGFAVLALGGFLTLLWRVELRKKRLSLSCSEHRT